MRRISTRIQGLLVSAALLVPLAAVPGTAAYAQDTAAQPTTTAQTAAVQPASAQKTAAKAASSYAGVVINEAYLSGGSKGAAYKNKFIELYNTTDKDISLAGSSLQYRSATGTGAASSAAALTGTIKAKGYYLAKAGSNGENGADLPKADVDATSLNTSGTKGTLLFAATTDKLSPTAGDTTGNADIIDALGYGDTNTFEKAPATAPKSNSDVKSLNRTNGVDTNDNSKDFTLSDKITPQSTGAEGGSTPDPKPQPTDCPTGEATIAQVQGTSDASPCDGATVTTKGVVTATWPEGGFNGYTIQTPATGGAVDLASHKASDGLFVYDSNNAKTLKAGDYVQVSGKVSEYYGLTELNATSVTKLTNKVDAPQAATVAFPKTDAERESLESMLVAPQGDYTVSDVYNSNKYGEIGLAASNKPFLNPTVKGLKGDAKTGAAYQAEVDRIAAEGVYLDDGSSRNFLDTKYPDNADTPLPYLSNDQPVRVGEKVTFTKPVVFDYRNSAWRFQPTTRLTGDNPADQPVTFANTRTDTPDLKTVGGDIRLGTFNVLNYFATTADETGCSTNNAYKDRDGNPVTAKNCDVRGAWDKANMERQRTKIVKAINNLGADVISLEEIENSAKAASVVPNDFKGERRDYALSTLVDALNAQAGAGTWAYAPSPKTLPALDTEDVIRTAFIYKPAKVETVGETHILTDSDAFNGKNGYEHGRQPDAQAFKAKGAADADAFLVVANHFKSKGSASNEQNQDPGDGSGNADYTRQAQADALLKFTDSIKSELKLSKVFLVGDFNAYYAEKPIQKIVAAGYTDLSEQVSEKTGKYTYAYTVKDDKGHTNGGVGSLDHIFANEAALKDVTGADIWNINSVESVALEYSRYNYNAKNLYQPDQFRASDHDPVVVGLKTEAAPEPSGNIIKDETTAVFLKKIDVGTDTVTLGSKNTKDVDISDWKIRDDKDTADHTYTIPAGTVLKAGGEAVFNLDQLAGIGLGKSDKVRVYDASGKLILQFAWSGDDKNAVYVANSDADGMVKEGETGPDNPGDKLDVAAWPGLDKVTAIDGEDEFGAGQATGEHTDGNLSGLAYQPGKDGQPGTLWAADNDLNPTLGITGPKGAGSINKFVYRDGKWQQDPTDGWTFSKDGKTKGGKQLHFKDGKGGVDSEAIALIPGANGVADPSRGVFIGAERDNENKNTPRPSILSYDVTAKTEDSNNDGAQDLTAAHEWNLVDALSQFGVKLEQGDDANLGVEGVAFIPDATLTAKGFKVNVDPKNVTAYSPDGFANSYGGLFFVALEKTNAIYALALSTKDGKDLVAPVSQFPLPQEATNTGYSGPRDLTWDAEHDQLLAQGDNTLGADEKPTKAMLATYEFKDGALTLIKLTATPAEIASGNSEGFAITPDAEAKSVEGGKDGKTYKPVFWADDAVTGGHSLREGWLEAVAPAPQPTKTTINLLNTNDFHGRIDTGLTVPFASTVQSLRAEYPTSSLFLGAGDLIGASLFNSSVQKDQPTIDVMNALDMKASAVGNHEFDQGYNDLINRVISKDGKRNAQWDYLGANVYKKGTKTPALQEYSIQDVDGVKVGVIGAVTQETSTLVSPGGIKDIEFGDPVEAVNRVAKQLTDGDESNGEADVIVAEYHEGATSSEDDKTGKPTLDEQKAASPVFKHIVDDTDPEVAAIFTAHTHMKYSYTDPAKNGRPIIQTGNYAQNVGQVVLDYDKKTGDVTYVKSGNVAAPTVPEGTTPADFDQQLADADKTGVTAKVKAIVDAAVKNGQTEGNRKVGSISADITTAFKDGARDDRASESTMGNLVADSLLSSLSSADRGGAQIGVVNPGGLRAEFCKTGENEKCTLAEDGSITYAQANAVLPFLNNLWTTTLTGAQFKEALEQQWQLDKDGKVPSRPYLQLGLSHNVSYTYDPDAAQGHHITSVTVNGKPLDLKAEYRIGSFSFLLQGGDNFRAFAAGKDTKDSGLIDRDAWIAYITANSPLKPRYDRRAVAVTGLPTGTVKAGSSFELKFSKLTLTSLGVPAETKLTATIGGKNAGSAAVKDGDTATLKVTVPADAKAGEATLQVVGETNGTTVTVPVSVAAGQTAPGGNNNGGNNGGNNNAGNGAGNGAVNNNGGNKANGKGNGSNAGTVKSLSKTGAPVAALLAATMALLAAGGITLRSSKRRDNANR